MEAAQWGEMLNVLKDISNYLEKQDSTIEVAKIKDAPGMQESSDPIKGGEDLSMKRREFAKNYVPAEDDEDEDKDEDKDEEDEEKVEKAEDEDSEEDEKEDEEEDKKKDEMDELKSILKDIASTLHKQSNVNVSDLVKAEIKKSVAPIIKSEQDKFLRKQGFVVSHPDVTKIDVNKSLGLDTTEEIKKSEDEPAKIEDKQSEVVKIVNDMTKKSWSELGQMREKTNGFSPFGS